MATLVLGSRASPGYTSHVRYTHYSLLRTIEAALGLGTLTRNDRYAQPTNDVFAAAPPGHADAAGRGHHATAFVVNSGSGSVTPVDLVSRKARRPIRVGARPKAIALVPGGRTALVVDSGFDAVTPIDVATRTAEKPIAVGADPEAIAVTPDGRTALVANQGSGSVTPIDVATRTAGTPIAVGADPGVSG